MGLHRKMASSSDSDSFHCKIFCDGSPCPQSCLCYCLDKCPTLPDWCPPPYPPITVRLDDDSSKAHHQISTIFVVAISILAAAFFVVCCYAVYVQFIAGWLSRRRRRGIPQQQETEVTHDDFIDEEQGPIVDNFIWYIRTNGLRQSIISKITVCKYKKGEGLIEGTECSVCLSEFEEDEDLRLLPKCNHAFHPPCIDTWLRSHTNCPMCRAPIVTNPSRFSSQETVVVDSGSVGNTQVEIVENNSGEINQEIEIEDLELRSGEEEGQLGGENGGIPCERSNSETEINQPRRSISLDSSSAAKINLALSTVLAVESDGNSRTGSKRVSGNKNLSTAKASSSSSSRARSLRCESSSMKRSLSYNGKNPRSWYGRSQRKPSVPIRSF